MTLFQQYFFYYFRKYITSKLIFLLHTHTHSFFLSLTHIHSLSHTNTHTLTNTHSLSHNHTHIHKHSRIFFLCPTHTQTHTQTHTLSCFHIIVVWKELLYVNEGRIHSVRSIESQTWRGFNLFRLNQKKTFRCKNYSKHLKLFLQ